MPHLLLVNSAHGYAGVLVDRNLDPFRKGELDGVAVPKVEHGLVSLSGGLVTDTIDLELALKTLGHSGHHVVQKSTHEPMVRAVGLAVVGP